MAVTIGPTPINITLGLPAGVHLAQVVALDSLRYEILYACGYCAPDDVRDYYTAGRGDFFTFRVGGGSPPTWVRTASAVGQIGEGVASATLAISEYRP